MELETKSLSRTRTHLALLLMGEEHRRRGVGGGVSAGVFPEIAADNRAYLVPFVYFSYSSVNHFGRYIMYEQYLNRRVQFSNGWFKWR